MDNDYIKHNIINRLWGFDYVHILVDSNDHLRNFFLNNETESTEIILSGRLFQRLIIRIIKKLCPVE